MWVAPPPLWGLTFPIRCQISACVRNTIGIDSADQAESWRTLSSTDFTKSTASVPALHDWRRIFAEHNIQLAETADRLLDRAPDVPDALLFGDVGFDESR